MAQKSIHFELSAGVLLVGLGFWLSQNDIADWGLMVVGCLLLALTLVSRFGEVKGWLQRFTGAAPASRRTPEPAGEDR